MSMEQQLITDNRGEWVEPKVRRKRKRPDPIDTWWDQFMRIADQKIDAEFAKMRGEDKRIHLRHIHDVVKAHGVDCEPQGLREALTMAGYHVSPIMDKTSASANYYVSPRSTKRTPQLHPSEPDDAQEVSA